MIGTDFASLVREYTQTDSTTLTNATIVLLATTAKEDMASKIAKAKEDAFVIPAFADLVADQREYALPADILNSINKVECKFSSSGDYIKLSEFDLNVYKRTDQESIIVSEFSNDEGNCFYDLRRTSMFIYSGTIVSVTNGIRLFYTVFPENITASDLASSSDLSTPSAATVVRLPRMFHELWARKISILWKSTRQRPVPLTESELLFKTDFDEKISEFKGGNTDRSITAKLPSDTHLQQ